MRTNDLRKLIKTILSDDSLGLQGVYYQLADEGAMYPHAEFLCDSIDLSDLSRHDYRVTIDVYTRSPILNEIEEICDKIEDLFQAKNLPQTDILPTFYLERRGAIIEDDKRIQRREISLICQLYD